MLFFNVILIIERLLLYVIFLYCKFWFLLNSSDNVQNVPVGHCPPACIMQYLPVSHSGSDPVSLAPVLTQKSYWNMALVNVPLNNKVELYLSRCDRLVWLDQFIVHNTEKVGMWHYISNTYLYIQHFKIQIELYFALKDEKTTDICICKLIFIIKFCDYRICIYTVLTKLFIIRNKDIKWYKSVLQLTDLNLFRSASMTQFQNLEDNQFQGLTWRNFRQAIDCWLPL